MTDFNSVKYTEEEFEKFSPRYFVELYHNAPSWFQGSNGMFILEKSAFLALVNDDGKKRSVIVEKKTWDQDQTTTRYEIIMWDEEVVWGIHSALYDATLDIANGNRVSFKALNIYNDQEEEA